jgi:hypothetical protein
MSLALPAVSSVFFHIGFVPDLALSHFVGQYFEGTATTTVAANDLASTIWDLHQHFQCNKCMIAMNSTATLDYK